MYFFPIVHVLFLLSRACALYMVGVLLSACVLAYICCFYYQVPVHYIW